MRSKRASAMQSIFCSSEGGYLQSVPGSALSALAAMLFLSGCQTLGGASTFVSAPPPAVASQTVLPATWQGRLSGTPRIFAIDYVQPTQLANGQGYESVFAMYPLVITGETYATANPMTTHLNAIRSLNANIVLIGYLIPLQDSLPDSTGPGYDAMRYLEGIESAYLHD